jgi:large subunit ribosomal protein L18
MNKNELKRVKRHIRFKLKVTGTQERPRLVVRRSLKNILAQMVDDSAHKTLFSLSSADKAVKSGSAKWGNIKGAEAFGMLFAKAAKEKGFSRIIFDRAGYLYHGRVKAFAEALRKGGLEF